MISDTLPSENKKLTIIETLIILINKQRLVHTPQLVKYNRPLSLNDLTIGWQNLNLLSLPNSTLAPQARQVRPSGEILNYLLSCSSDDNLVRSLTQRKMRNVTRVF